MSRKLSPRELILLGVLAVIAVVAGYVMLFYMPTTEARDAALAEAETYRQQTSAAQVRLAEKQRMERELDALFAESSVPPTPLSEYDNLRPIMVKLDSILEDTDYKLTFATVDDTQSIIRREISIDFTCGNYIRAKGVLKDLGSYFRCMLNDIKITNGGNGGSTKVTGSIVYFECKP